MTDQSLFQEENNNPQATPEQQNPNSTENPFADQLGSIRNEKGEPKYASVETALEALKHSQEYIPQLSNEKQRLEQEVSDLKAKLEAQERLQEALQGQPTQEPNQPPASTGLSAEDVEKLLADKLQQREAASVAQSNASRVNQELVARFGANAQAEVNKRAAELNMTASELGELAKSKPDMVLQLFGKGGSVKPITGGSHLPSQQSNHDELERPKKSLLAGATSQEQADFMRQVREHTYKKLGIQE